MACHPAIHRLIDDGDVSRSGDGFELLQRPIAGRRASRRLRVPRVVRARAFHVVLQVPQRSPTRRRPEEESHDQQSSSHVSPILKPAKRVVFRIAVRLSSSVNAS